MGGPRPLRAFLSGQLQLLPPEVGDYDCVCCWYFQKSIILCVV